MSKHPFGSCLAQKMMELTSTRFFDWIDHIVIPDTEDVRNELENSGYVPSDGRETEESQDVYIANGTTLFPIIMTDDSSREVALKVENLTNFIQMVEGQGDIQGEMFSPYRMSPISSHDDYVLKAVERRGYNGFVAKDSSSDIDYYQSALENFLVRPRINNSTEEGMKDTFSLVKSHLKDLSKERVTDAFFHAERIYWQNHCLAGATQKLRQDRLGLGWGNHDHHTYRSSRDVFHVLIEILETLGFHSRERFFAGKKAGWGAQVLEQPICDFIVFADIDITDEEQEMDFAHKKLDTSDKLGTVGLWTTLHGESILEAGLHHLAVRVNFERVRPELKNRCVDTLRPFSDFEFLKQAFTEVERRKVRLDRAKRALKQELISKEQFDNFVENGAIGNHLEIIQRGQGFKGFNQDSVSVIIEATDPRHQKERGA